MFVMVAKRTSTRDEQNSKCLSNNACPFGRGLKKPMVKQANDILMRNLSNGIYLKIHSADIKIHSTDLKIFIKVHSTDLGFCVLLSGSQGPRAPQNSCT